MRPSSLVRLLLRARLALLSGAACGSASTGPVSRGEGLSRDATTAPTASDGDASYCTSLDEACTRDSGGGFPSYRCVSDWTAARKPATWCTSNYLFVTILPNCGGYNVVVESPLNSDLATQYYYSTATGALLAIKLWSDNTQSASCIGGRDTLAISLGACLPDGRAVSVCEGSDAAAD